MIVLYKYIMLGVLLTIYSLMATIVLMILIVAKVESSFGLSSGTRYPDPFSRSTIDFILDSAIGGALMMAVFWPLTVLFMLLVSIVDSYRERVRLSVTITVTDAASNPQILKNLSAKKLKKIQHAHKIKALYVPHNVLKKVEEELVDKEFEKNFL